MGPARENKAGPLTTSKNKGSSSGKSTTLVGERGQAEVQEQEEEAAAVVVMVLPAVAVVVLLVAVPGSSNGIEKHAHIAVDPRLTAGSVDLLHGTISVPAAATSMSKSDLRMRI